MVTREQQKTIYLSEWRNFTPKQIEALSAIYEHEYVIYGGARGGGKSYLLRHAALDYLLWAYRTQGLSNVRVMLASETYKTLIDRQINFIEKEFPPEFGVLKDTQGGGLGFYLHDSLGGGVIALRNLDKPAKYQSAEFAAIFVDELTKNPKKYFDLLRGSLRWPGLSHTPFVAATNPGGIGHAWVKALWIEKDYSAYPELAGVADQFHFIQSLPQDNPHLGKSYWATLDTLPENLRRAWRDGDWDVFEGMAFPHFDRHRHVLKKPLDLPEDWPRWRAIDWGFTSPFCCLWLCKDPDNGRVFVYRELYLAGMTDRDQARLILENTPPEENISITYADPSMWALKNWEGKVSSSADEFTRENVYLMKGDNDRIGGKRKVDRHLSKLEDGLPGILIYPQCKNLISNLANLPLNEFKVEDVDPEQEDHAYDALRYGLTNIGRHGPRREIDNYQSPFERYSDIF